MKNGNHICFWSGGHKKLYSRNAFWRGRMRVLIAFSLLLATSFFGGAVDAAAGNLAGVWSGGGFVTPKSGKKERIRCRVTYSKQSDKVYSVSANCATSEMKVYQSGNILAVGNNRYVGDFYNSQWDVNGKVRVVVSGNSQSVVLTSASGSGRLSLKKR